MFLYSEIKHLIIFKNAFIVTNIIPIKTLNSVAIKYTLFPEQFINMTKSPAERLLYVLRVGENIHLV